MTGTYTRPLGDLRGSDEPSFGGKSAGLGELLAAGIAVPPGFALSTSALDRHLRHAGLEPLVKHELAGLDPDRLDSVQRALEGKPPRRVIVVPGRIVNVVA